MTKKYGGDSGGPPSKVIKGKAMWVPPPVGGTQWSGYHVNPTVRAKDKTKGANKKRSQHDDSAWRDSYFAGGGFSSASVLARLARQDRYSDSDDEEEDNNGSGYGGDHYADDEVGVGDVAGCGTHASPGVEVRDVGGGGDEAEEEEGKEDCMSFCEVGYVVDQIEESDWCLVEEM